MIADINKTVNNTPQVDRKDHLVRPRLNKLLEQAIQKPVVIVCAGAGCGKTRAVFDFTKDCGIPTAWLQCSELDNINSRFWENFTHAVAQVNKPLAEEIKSINPSDFKQVLAAHKSMSPDSVQRRLYVVDDFHLISNPEVLRFFEKLANDDPKGRTVIIICRNRSDINIIKLQVDGLVETITDSDLNFTESEAKEFLRQMEVPVETRVLRDILEDTKGWAFAASFFARALLKSPGYLGYVRNAVMKNIAKLMETDIWNNISEELRRFLASLSLIEHLSAELVTSLAHGDKDLLCEFNRQHAYIRYDDSIDAYFIHHLFKDFLSKKQYILTDEEKHTTYNTAAIWCERNDYVVDALEYYEKCGNYEAITAILSESPKQLLKNTARHLKGIFDRAPKETFDKVELFAVVHARILINMGLFQEAIELMTGYEERLQKLPADNAFRNRTMGVMYYAWGVARLMLSTKDDHYDFDQCFAKTADCANDLSYIPLRNSHPVGPWVNLVSSDRQEALQECIESLSRSEACLKQSFNDWLAGINDLARGELLFYKGDIPQAEAFFIKALDKAQSSGQFKIKHRALFYTMRLAVLQGNYAKFTQALKDMEAQLENKDYYDRFFTYDIAQSWYHYILRIPENVTDWLKEKFKPCFNPVLLDNFANQMKLRYHYLTRNYLPLLSYIEEQKTQTQILFGRIEHLALESCALYQMGEREEAFTSLREAYQAASTNEIVMPFIELGKEMRSLTLAALRCPDIQIPKQWLETINRKSSYYAKYQSIFIANNQKGQNNDGTEALSPRENQILRDLYNGLSQSEIAAKESLSIGTIKMVYKNIFNKLNAHSLADVIRIAAEQKLV